MIFHHFGSKNGLRAACDDYVLNVLIERARTAGRPSGLVDLLGVYLSDPDQYRLRCKYMARTIQQDTRAANTFVETMVAESEAIFRSGAADGTMRPSSDHERWPC